MRWIWDTLQTQLNNSKPQFLWPFVVHSIIWWCCWWHQRMSKVDVYTYCVNKNMDGTYRYTYSYILHYIYIYIIIYNYIYIICMYVDRPTLVGSFNCPKWHSYFLVISTASPLPWLGYPAGQNEPGHDEGFNQQTWRLNLQIYGFHTPKLGFTPGKLPYNYGKSPFSIGKFKLQIGHVQSLHEITGGYTPCWGCRHVRR